MIQVFTMLLFVCAVEAELLDSLDPIKQLESGMVAPEEVRKLVLLLKPSYSGKPKESKVLNQLYEAGDSDESKCNMDSLNQLNSLIFSFQSSTENVIPYLNLCRRSQLISCKPTLAVQLEASMNQLTVREQKKIFALAYHLEIDDDEGEQSKREIAKVILYYMKQNQESLAAYSKDEFKSYFNEMAIEPCETLLREFGGALQIYDPILGDQALVSQTLDRTYSNLLFNAKTCKDFLSKKDTIYKEAFNLWLDESSTTKKFFKKVFKI